MAFFFGFFTSMGHDGRPLPSLDWGGGGGGRNVGDGAAFFGFFTSVGPGSGPLPSSDWGRREEEEGGGALTLIRLGEEGGEGGDEQRLEKASEGNSSPVASMWASRPLLGLPARTSPHTSPHLQGQLR